MTRGHRASVTSVTILALIMAGCAATSGAGGTPPPAPAGGAVVVAHNLAFDRQRLDVPAGAAFGLLFENRDNAPHNVTILDQGGAGVRGRDFRRAGVANVCRAAARGGHLHVPLRRASRHGGFADRSATLTPARDEA